MENLTGCTKTLNSSQIRFDIGILNEDTDDPGRLVRFILRELKKSIRDQ